MTEAVVTGIEATGVASVTATRAAGRIASPRPGADPRANMGNTLTYTHRLHYCSQHPSRCGKRKGQWMWNPGWSWWLGDQGDQHAYKNGTAWMGERKYRELAKYRHAHFPPPMGFIFLLLLFFFGYLVSPSSTSRSGNQDNNRSTQSKKKKKKKKKLKKKKKKYLVMGHHEGWLHTSSTFWYSFFFFLFWLLYINYLFFIIFFFGFEELV